MVFNLLLDFDRRARRGDFDSGRTSARIVPVGHRDTEVRVATRLDQALKRFKEHVQLNVLLRFARATSRVQRHLRDRDAIEVRWTEDLKRPSVIRDRRKGRNISRILRADRWKIDVGVRMLNSAAHRTFEKFHDRETIGVHERVVGAEP